MGQRGGWERRDRVRHNRHNNAHGDLRRAFEGLEEGALRPEKIGVDVGIVIQKVYALASPGNGPRQHWH